MKSKIHEFQIKKLKTINKRFFQILVLVLAFNANGQSPAFNWVKQQGLSSRDQASNVAIDNNDNLFTLVKISFSDIGQLIKYDTSGTILWTKNIGGTPEDITVDSLGNVYIVGTFFNQVDFDTSAAVSNLGYVNFQSLVFKFVLKLDNDGNFLLAKEIGGTPSSIAIDSNQNIFITGIFKLTEDFDPSPSVINQFTSLDGYSIFITKLDNAGSFVWNKVIGKSTVSTSGFGNCGGKKVLIDASNNVLVAGFFSDDVDFDPSTGDTTYTSGGSSHTENPFTLKLDNTGNFVWAKYFQSNQESVSEDMTLDSAGNIYTTGTLQGQMDFDSSANTLYLFHQYRKVPYVSKMDSNGNIIWAKQIFTTDWGCDLKKVKIDNNGNIYTLGDFKNTLNYTTPTGAGTATTAGFQIRNVFISVLNPAGNLISFNHLGGADITFPIDLQLKNSNIYFSGNFGSVVDFDCTSGVTNLTSAGLTDSFVAKYNISSFLNTNNFSKINFKLYPNPTSSQINLSFENNLENANLKIISLLGQTVLEKQNLSGNNLILDVANLAKGMYVIEVTDGELKFNSKFIKQ